MSSAEIQSLARRLRALEKARLAAKTPQLANSTIVGGAIQATDPMDNLTMIVGQQFDGSNAAVVVNGPTPPTPTMALASAVGANSLTIYWDGTFADGSVAPMDFSRVTAHMVPLGEEGTIDPTDQTHIVAEFHSATGSTASISATPGDYAVVLFSWSLAGSFSSPSDVADVTVTASLTDGIPPTASPTPDVTSGLGSLFVTWPAADNDDPVTYQLHVSATPGFTPSSSSLLGSTTATMANIRTLPDGTPLLAGTTYYVLVVASDGDGDATNPGDPGSGEIKLATATDIAADYVYAGKISVNQLVSGTMNAVVALAGQLSVGARATNGGVGAGVDINSSGITLFDSSNRARTVMDAATGNATFRGNGEFDALTTLNGLSVRGNLNELSRGADMTAQEGVTPSQVGPSVIMDWSTIVMALAAGYSGWFLRYTGTDWEVFSSDGTNHRLERYAASNGAFSSLTTTYTEDTNHSFVGATQLGGSNLFVAKLPAAGANQYGIGIGAQSSDINDYARFVSGSSTVEPSMCSDGSYLYLADLQATTNVRVYKFDPSTADATLLTNDFETDASSANGGSFVQQTVVNTNVVTDPLIQGSNPGWGIGSGMSSLDGYGGGSIWGSPNISTPGKAYFNSPMYPVSANASVRFGLTIERRGTTGQVGLMYRIYNASGGIIGTDNDIPGSTLANGATQSFDRTITTPSGAAYIRLFPYAVKTAVANFPTVGTTSYLGSPGVDQSIYVIDGSTAIFTPATPNTATDVYDFSGAQNASSSYHWTVSAVTRGAFPGGTTGWSGSNALSATQTTAGKKVRIASDNQHNFPVSSVNNVYRVQGVKLLVTGTGASTRAGTLEIAWLDASGKELGRATKAWSDTRSGPTTPITVPALTAKPVAGTTQMAVRVVMNDLVGATLWVDDITVSQLHGVYDVPTTDANLTVPSGVTSLDALYIGNGDFGAKRYMLVASTAAGQQLLVYPAPGGAATASESFPLPSGSRGLAYDGTQFKSLSGNTLSKHEPGTKTIDSSMVQYAGFTWKAVAPHTAAETNLSALTTFTGGKRKRITITTPPISDLGSTTDPNAVGIYVGQATSPTVPTYATMWLQGTPAIDVNQLLVSSLVTSGTSAPNPATNPGFAVATPSVFHSARKTDGVNDDWKLSGDGIWKLGPLSGDGTSLSTAYGMLTSDAGIPISSGSEQIVTWKAANTVLRGGMTATTTALTVPDDGYYQVEWQIVYPSNATGRRFARSVIDGVVSYLGGYDDTAANNQGGGSILRGSAIMFLDAGTTFGVNTYQNSTISLSLVASSSYLQLLRVG